MQGAERAAAICTLLGKEKKPDPAELKQAAAAPGIQGPSLIDPTAHATSAFMKGERVTAVSGWFSMFSVSTVTVLAVTMAKIISYEQEHIIQVHHIVPGNSILFGILYIMIGDLKIYT